MAEGGGGLGGFLSGLMDNDTLKQIVIWQIVAQAVGTILGPYQQMLSDFVNSKTPVVPLSPADLSSAVVRGFMPLTDAAAEAGKAGIDVEEFKILVGLSGDAPGPQQLAEALRRGIIPDDAGDPNRPGFVQGIAQGRLADKWTDMIRQLATALPSPEMALDALLEGQVDEQTALDLYKKFGGDPEYFKLLFNTRGSAPTPMEAIGMANRGYIPWEGTGADTVSFQQAFLEGPWRDKWQEPFRKYAEYLPPVVQVRTLLSHGAITHDQAIQLYQAHGLTPEMAQAYISVASTQKTTATKQLAEGTVTKLYYDRLIDEQTATTMLEALKFTAQEAAFILQIQDISRVQHALSTALTRIHSLYISHKIAKADALHALNTLAVPAKQVDELITIWDLESFVNVHVLTPAQIASAWNDGIMSEDEAMQELQHLGYQPYDAWVILSLKNKGPLPNRPAKTDVLPIFHQ